MFSRRQYPTCTICGKDTYAPTRRTNTTGEKVTDVCSLCNYSVLKKIGRMNRRAPQNSLSRMNCAQWIEILQQSQGYCYYCKEYEGCNSLTPDHVIPLGKGGENSPENIVAACLFCNVGKQASSAEQWLERIRNGYFQQPGVTYIRNGRRVEA